MQNALNRRRIFLLFVKILAVVLAVEGAIMVAFNLLPNPFDEWAIVVLDVSLLAVISTPLVYVTCISPYVKLSENALLAEQRSRAKLESVNRDLEFQKQTLDEHAIVSIADMNGEIIYANDKFCDLSGYSREELYGKTHHILSSDYHQSEFYRNLWGTISSGKPWHGVIKNRNKHGTGYWINATIVPFLDESGKPFQYVSVSTDITKQRLAEEGLKLAQSVARMGSWSLDLHTNKLEWSDEIFRIFGVKPEEFGASLEAFMDLVHPEDLDYVKEQFVGSIDGKYQYDIEHRIIRHDTGEVRWVHEICVHQYSDNGDVVRSDGVVQDITERKQAQDEIRRLAMTDQLTGLANRNQFGRRFEESVNIAKRENRLLALMLLDLDKFKPVNDTYGHQTGDELLITVAQILRRSCREIDIVARLGGDEFAILLLHPVDILAIETVATRIIENINKPIRVLGKNVSIGISIGIAQYPVDGIGYEDLMHKADKAMYRAKNLGRNKYLIFQNN